MSDERRSTERISAEMLVQFRVENVDEFMREYAVNISPGGMFVRTERPQPLGSNVYLQFQLADGGSLIEGLAKVVHVNPPDDPVPGMGLEFVNLEKKSRLLIEQILQERNDELRS
jgi:uncharacterized protein (TIGR02266 family)